MYRVFLADDEPWILISLKNLIDWGECGFVICGEATDGIKAWERIVRTKPDLIISDIKMPGMDGIELIKKGAGGKASGRGGDNQRLFRF